MAVSSTTMLAPGAVIGILGGGQLGRMLALSAATLGFRVHVYSPDADAPAACVSERHTVADYEDEEALRAFAAATDVITYEFENVPAATARLLASLGSVRPGPQALDVAQDRFVEKNFLRSLGLGTAPYAKADDSAEAAAGFDALGGSSAIVKTRRMGYDGKGQVGVTSAREAADAVATFGVPCIVEGMVNFVREVSVVAARGLDRRIEAFDPGENRHKSGILDTTTVPARLKTEEGAEAWRMAGLILETLDYVGVIGVEMFVMNDGTLLVNEIAPRVHNTGHWTMDACGVSQFEQHIRAIVGWPLKPAVRHADCVMENLIGDDVDRWASLAGEINAALHLYGKGEARPGRKMGHVNRLFPLGYV